jgi:hypothetical protein
VPYTADAGVQGQLQALGDLGACTSTAERRQMRRDSWHLAAVLVLCHGARPRERGVAHHQPINAQPQRQRCYVLGCPHTRRAGALDGSRACMEASVHQPAAAGGGTFISSGVRSGATFTSSGGGPVGQGMRSRCAFTAATSCSSCRRPCSARSPAAPYTIAAFWCASIVSGPGQMWAVPAAREASQGLAVMHGWIGSVAYSCAVVRMP